MTVASPYKSITVGGEFYLLPSELPWYFHPSALQPFVELDGPEGEDAVLGLLRGMLGEDGFRRFLEAVEHGDIGREDFRPLIRDIYAQYGVTT